MDAAGLAPGAAADSIVAFIARARRRRQWRSLSESAALGLGAAGAAAAAAVWSSAPSAPSAVALAACACVSGLAMAGTWWVERAKLDDLHLAQRIDLRLGQDGALSSAYQARGAPEVGGLAALLERRVLAGLTRGSLAKAQPGPGWIWIAPPALGAALLALALEIAPAKSAPPAPYGIAEAGAPAGAAMARAATVLEQARAQAPAAAADPRLHAEVLAAIDSALADLGTGSGAAGEGARSTLVERLLDLRSSIESDAPAGAPAGAPGAGGGGNGTEGDSSLLKNGAGERTMSGSNRATTVDRDPGRAASPSGARSEAGTLAGRWWPERHDPVVQGWRRVLATRPAQR